MPPGAVYVTWGTDSPDFPATPGAVQPSLGGGTDAFVAKLVLQLPPEDVVTIPPAIFVDELALLVVVATSSAVPDAELFVTVPECLLRVPMVQAKERYLLVRTVPECEGPRRPHGACDLQPWGLGSCPSPLTEERACSIGWQLGRKVLVAALALGPHPRGNLLFLWPDGLGIDGSCPARAEFYANGFSAGITKTV